MGFTQLKIKAYLLEETETKVKKKKKEASLQWTKCIERGRYTDCKWLLSCLFSLPHFVRFVS
jgi:hypothetical protein